MEEEQGLILYDTPPKREIKFELNGAFPSRARQRQWRACDAARIAREVLKNSNNPDLTPEMIIACVAKGFGYDAILTKKPPKTAIPAVGSVSLAGDTVSQFAPIVGIGAVVGVRGAVGAVKLLGKASDRLKLGKISATIKALEVALRKAGDFVDDFFDLDDPGELPDDSDADFIDDDGTEYEVKKTKDLLGTFCKCRR